MGCGKREEKKGRGRAACHAASGLKVGAYRISAFRSESLNRNHLVQMDKYKDMVYLIVFSSSSISPTSSMQ